MGRSLLGTVTKPYERSRRPATAASLAARMTLPKSYDSVLRLRSSSDAPFTVSKFEIPHGVSVAGSSGTPGRCHGAGSLMVCV